jgi:uncharacterized membrane protein
MKRLAGWLWNRSICSTFLAGLFVILPVAITVAIMVWVGGIAQEWLGPESIIGRALREVGLRFIANETVALVLGWAIAIVVIWLVGALVKSAAKYRLAEAFDGALNRLPLIGAIHRPVSQAITMLKQKDSPEMKSMDVVYCEFGGTGLLGLRVSKKRYRFRGRDCYVVYLPTSPVPMSGGIVFAPVDSVSEVDMEIDNLMQVYFSLGVMCETAVPEKYLSSPPAA